MQWHLQSCRPITISHLCRLLARFSSTPSGLMAGDDWERELRNKLRQLAGRDTGWLLRAATALDQESEAYKKLVLEEEDDDHARKLVAEVMKRESPCSAAQPHGMCMCMCSDNRTTAYYPAQAHTPENPA